MELEDNFVLMCGVKDDYGNQCTNTDFKLMKSRVVCSSCGVRFFYSRMNVSWLEEGKETGEQNGKE